MRKDAAVALRERLAVVGAQAAEKAGFPALVDDGKLGHDEFGESARWALRLTLPGWPHRLDAPGLRFEAWFMAGKPKPDEEVLLLLVVSETAALAGLRAHLGPVMQELVNGGRYARRYRSLEPLVLGYLPGAIGVGRRAPLTPAKLEAAWATLVADALKPVSAAVDAWDPDGNLRIDLKAGPAADPMEALRLKFGK